MQDSHPGVNGSSTPDTALGRAWEAAHLAQRVKDLRFHSEPLPATDARFVRITVTEPAGEILYDQVVRADEYGLEAGTRDIAAATGVEPDSIEPRIASIIADVKRHASRGSGQSQAGPDDVLAGIVDLNTFLSQHEPEEWLVTKLLVARDPVIMGGPKKSLKTSVAIDLAVSLGSGTPFLGAFVVPRPVRTLVFSGESSRGTLRRLVRQVCQERRVAPAACEVRLGSKLPRLSDPDHLAQLGAYLRDQRSAS